MTAFNANTINSPGETQLLVSEIVTVGTTITLTVGRENHAKAHCYLGAEFFSDDAGTPSAATGTATATVSTVANPQGTDVLTGGAVITASAPSTLSWDGNTREVVVTPSGIGTATHWRVNLVMNRS